MSPLEPEATARPPRPRMSPASQGLWLGLLGIALFSATLPMTKLALGSSAAPQLSPWFVTFGRAAVAGVLSALYLAVLHWRGQMKMPRGGQWGLLAVTGISVVVGFPLFMALALQYVPSTHGAVVTGLLPLATAGMAALWYRQRPSAGFWACALLGTGLVLGFMALRSLDAGGHMRLHLADIFLLLAMGFAPLGYIAGARLTPALGAEGVICWVLVGALPITVPLALWWMPPNASAIGAASWGGFAYVALFSMWLGFFAWYRALAIGGAVRVSQVQLLQPFLSLLFAVPLLGEAVDAITLGFGLAVVATVLVGKNMSVST